MPEDVIERLKDLSEGSAEIGLADLDSDLDVVKQNEYMETGNTNGEKEIILEVEEEIPMIEENDEVERSSVNKEEENKFEEEVPIMTKETENISQNLGENQDDEIRSDILDRTHAYNLRPSRDPDYSYKFSFLSVNAGIQKWGDKAKNAIGDELQLFVKKGVFKKVNNPTVEQTQKALRMHCFATEKQDGRIKARAVADGRTHVRYMEEETYSPTVRLESIMLTSLVDAVERRYVKIIDIKGAFLKASVPKNLELLVKVEGELAKIMKDLQLDFYIQDDGFMYLKCVKALYRHIEAARLFYEDMNKSLTEKMGFMRNCYDPCVYNKRTQDGMMTV